MLDVIISKSVAKALVLPPTGPLLLALIGLAIARRRPRLGSSITLFAITTLLALSTPRIAWELHRRLDTTPALDLALAKDAKAIIILGGGVRRGAVEYGGDTLGRLTLERTRYGAHLARQLHLPVLVSGGSVDGNWPTEAALMRAALANEYGIDVRWVEDRSHNTRQNAIFSAAILAKESVDRAILVVHSFDVPRAVAEFARAGISVIPAPTGVHAGEFDWPGDYLPGIAGLTLSYYVCYEFAALAVSWLETHVR
jgi:uncharacterized SAM-binding protein YcdF (DUF218 family)